MRDLADVDPRAPVVDASAEQLAAVATVLEQTYRDRDARRRTLAVLAVLLAFFGGLIEGGAFLWLDRVGQDAWWWVPILLVTIGLAAVTAAMALVHLDPRPGPSPSPAGGVEVTPGARGRSPPPPPAGARSPPVGTPSD